MEHVLFKISFPAEFHAQTAVEAADRSHRRRCRDGWGDIDRIALETQESGDRIIDKTGPLANPADRDHCLQYMVAIGLLKGRSRRRLRRRRRCRSADRRTPRARWTSSKNDQFTRDYLDPAKRSIGNAIQIRFRDGSATERVAVEYPIGHRRRRREGVPLLLAKFERNVRGRLSADRADELIRICDDPSKLEPLPVHYFLDLLQAPAY